MSTFVRPKWTGFGRAVLMGAFVALFGAPAGLSGQDLADKYERNRLRQLETPRARFSLHAEPAVVLQANQFQCGLRNQGDTCTDIFNSPTGGGGFWPTGSPNQYMFNSGIMIAGIISEEGGPWAGDTTGAYFMDARGTQQHGTPITNIYNSLNPDDLANWPAEGTVPGFDFATAYITDASIFNSVLLDRASGSQQDTWVMYWDGDPALSANRDHPMGITIEQRTMAWNFPSGNEATIATSAISSITMPKDRSCRCAMIHSRLTSPGASRSRSWRTTDVGTRAVTPTGSSLTRRVYSRRRSNTTRHWPRCVSWSCGQWRTSASSMSSRMARSGACTGCTRSRSRRSPRRI